MILILGASGYIGRQLAAAYEPAEYVGTYRSHPVADSIYFDATTMRLENTLPRDADFSHAVVLFANPDIDSCKQQLPQSYELNVRGTKVVIDSLQKLGIKPVFISSEQVFNGKRGGYSELDAPDPVNVYGQQKLELEEYLAEQGGDYAVLRFAKVFGTDPSDKTIFSGWLRQIRRGEEIRCARDQVFSPIHVQDVVALIQAAIRQDLSGIFHVANVESFSRIEMLRILIERYGQPAKVQECSIHDFDFLDNRAEDVSLLPHKLLGATGLSTRTISSCCEELISRL